VYSHLIYTQIEKMQDHGGIMFMEHIHLDTPKRILQIYKRSRKFTIAKDHAESLHQFLTHPGQTPKITQKYKKTITEFIGIYRKDRVEQTASYAIQKYGKLNTHTFVKSAMAIEHSYQIWEYYKPWYHRVVAYEDILEQIKLIKMPRDLKRKNPDKGDLSEYRHMYYNTILKRK